MKKDTALRITIKAELAKRGKTEYQMAKDLGKHANSFGASLNNTPRLPTLQLYARYLEIPTPELVRLVEEMEKHYQ